MVSPERPDTILIGLNDRDPKWLGWAVDLATAERALENSEFWNFAFDWQLNPRVARKVEPAQGGAAVSRLVDGAARAVAANSSCGPTDDVATILRSSRQCFDDDVLARPQQEQRLFASTKTPARRPCWPNMPRSTSATRGSSPRRARSRVLSDAASRDAGIAADRASAHGADCARWTLGPRRLRLPPGSPVAGKPRLCGCCP